LCGVVNAAPHHAVRQPKGLALPAIRLHRVEPVNAAYKAIFLFAIALGQ
jgi:hypothetical protein